MRKGGMGKPRNKSRPARKNEHQLAKAGNTMLFLLDLD
jgi:hypothetical protein